MKLSLALSIFRALRLPLFVFLWIGFTMPSFAEHWVTTRFGAFDADLAFYDPAKNVVLGYFREAGRQYWRAFLCTERTGAPIGWWLSAPNERRGLDVFAFDQRNDLDPATARYELPHSIPRASEETEMRAVLCSKPQSYGRFMFRGWIY